MLGGADSYLTAAALDGGVIVLTIVVLFAMTLPSSTIPQGWETIDVHRLM